MSVNSSSPSNASHPPSLSSSASIFNDLHSCLQTKVGLFNITTYTITYIAVVLPLCIYVLYVGIEKWWQQRSNMTMSHSDVFTYLIIITEFLSVFGFCLVCCGAFTDLPQMVEVGVYLFVMNSSAQTFYHILTCVERYLAVVHPITYLSLRKEKGVRLRNITIGCVWLLCIALLGITSAADAVSFVIFDFIILAVILIIISFCSLSVLCVLIRPGPGERIGNRQQVDQSKMSAFCTIMVILGVLLSRILGSVLSSALYSSPHLREPERCGWWLSQFWFCLPSSLVLPLLFLHRAGKLLFCKNNSN